jgi:hypothetical protein
MRKGTKPSTTRETRFRRLDREPIAGAADQCKKKDYYVTANVS